MIKDFEKTEIEVKATLEAFKFEKAKLVSELDGFEARMKNGEYPAQKLKENDYCVDYSKRLADDRFKFAFHHSRAVWPDLDFTLIKNQWVDAWTISDEGERAPLEVV